MFNEVFEKQAKEILEKHDCNFIEMISETRCVWKNKIGIVRIDDVAVLGLMSESAWDFWINN